MKISKVTFYILMVVAMVFWGASWVAVKVFSNYITALELVSYRYAITTITLIPVIIYFKYSFKIDLRNFALAFVASLFLIVYSIFFFEGAKYGTAGLGGAFVTTLTPILTFILLVSFFKKKFSKIDIFALFLGAIGVITILNIWQFGLESIITKANLYFVYASISWSFLTISNSKVKTVNHLVFSFYLFLITTILSTIITPFESGNIFNFDNIFWFNLLLISIGSTTFATSIYFVAITRIGANEANSFIFLVPFNAIFLSYIFLDEPIYITAIFGVVLTIIAVWILNKIKLPKFIKRN
jgi:drug/metabolite transporter (DMT)-like permease